MKKYRAAVFSEECRTYEMNKISKALKNFENAKILLEKAQMRYAEVVYNQCWRTWHYTNFDKLFQNIIRNTDLKNCKYNDLKVFENIRNLNEKYLKIFSISKDAIEYFNPKNIKDLANVFATGDYNSSEFIMKRYHKTDEVPDFIKPFLKDTCNLILFDYQIKKILYKIFKNKQHTYVMFNTICQIRYKFSKYELKRNYEENGKFSIREFLKNQYFDTYYNFIGRPYLTVKNNLTELNIDEQEINKIFDVILWGIFTFCNGKKAIKCAKYLYFVSEFDLNKIDIKMENKYLSVI